MLFIVFFVLTIVLLFVFFYCLTAFTGGWFVPTPKKVIREMLETVKPKSGLLIDLGSGDGRMVIEAAKRGILTLGIEINPFLFLWSKIMARHLKLINHAHFELGSFWSKDLSKASIVTIYLPITSKRLEEKLKAELKKGSLVVTYRTGFPTWRPHKITKSGIFIYQL